MQAIANGETEITVDGGVSIILKDELIIPSGVTLNLNSDSSIIYGSITIKGVLNINCPTVIYGDVRLNGTLNINADTKIYGNFIIGW